ncbi:universal stress protein [Streptomyces sp. GQFP]|uniref:universal stress protein n=1 Tax=Streptomyces sp. GQFP TaxID=2907545 RepID=UPI001F32A83B|nr:universal stress protein [Streptomyces sp. GQFP]UIX34236.1 universal stress protein [Streptomyces sp. GQFP]
MSQWLPRKRHSGERRPALSGAAPAPGAALPLRHDPFRHAIVVGYSGSPSDERTLAYASGVALRAGRGLVIVHVTHRLPSPSWWEDGEPMTLLDLPDDSSESLTAALARTGQLTQVPWVAVHTRGDVRHELEEISRRYAADAIVVGASRSITAKLFGCVGSRLARQPRHPVIIIP